MNKWLRALVTLAVLVVADTAYATPNTVPEINASSAVTAVGVLVGAVALIAERFRRK